MDLSSLVELKQRLDRVRAERRALSDESRRAIEAARRAIEQTRETVEIVRRQRRELEAERVSDLHVHDV